MDETGIDQSTMVAVENLNANNILTHFELMLLGSSQKEPGTGKHYLMDRAAMENFPEWIFTPRALESHTLTEINKARMGDQFGGNIIYSPGLVGLEYELPEDHEYGVILDQLNPSELPKIEFCISKRTGEWPKMENEEVLDQTLIKGVKVAEGFERYFKLEEVPDHPGRRYLIPVRKS